MNLLVVGDSLCFHGPVGPLAADDPRLWHSVAASSLGGSSELIAGFGWTARDAWWAVTGDPRFWAALARADVLVLAVGGMDTLPSPLPTYLREGLRFLRPDALRRRVRAVYLGAQPWLSRLGGPVALPAHLTERYLDDCVRAVRTLRPGLPVVGMVPPVHRAAVYGYVHSGRPAGEAAVRRWALRHEVPLLDLPSLIGEHVRGGHGNPDGIHWGFDAHRAVGQAMADTVRHLDPVNP
ncbi:diglucosylglycerate octanoyltransferase [Kutzneria chonburiensis]|uniref:Diglucosylglycerate octanoyltransferase n=1 Tax=Kutzneria chonburiensis TaxID=1483604 RepID=A0ABV6N516_9PSEU|nr:diglucosylglycerate octanoyltransferase [Kutzneria chonburiensis]